MIQSLITVIGKDRPGIIAGVTRSVSRRGSNLEDISMTVMEGEFCMMMIASFKNRGQRDLAEKDCTRLAKQRGLTVYWKDFKARELSRGKKHAKDSQSYLVSVAGRDRSGIVHHVSDLFARKKLNITDLNCRIMGHGKNAVYLMMLEIDVPKRYKLGALETALRKVARKLNVEISIRPAEILEA